MTKKIGLRLFSHVIGCDPQPLPGDGDARFPVYADRDHIGAWEELELTKHDDGSFSARFLSADRQLCITPEGRLETRPAGAVGGWERFRAAEQPPGWDVTLLYPIDGPSVVLAVTVLS